MYEGFSRPQCFIHLTLDADDEELGKGEEGEEGDDGEEDNEGGESRKSEGRGRERHARRRGT